MKTIEEIMDFVQKDAPNMPYDKDFFEYMKKRLDYEEVAALVVHLKSEEEIKTMTEMFCSRIIEGIINLINKEEFTKYCLENSYELATHAKVEIILKLNDIEYTKKCIEENIAKLGIIQRIDLVLALNDPEYTKECILEDKVDAGPHIIKELFFGLDDSEFTLQCLEGPMAERISYGTKLELLINSRNKEKMREWATKDTSTRTRAILKYFLQDKSITQDKKKLTIPNDLHYGIEIESTGGYTEVILDLVLAQFSRSVRQEKAKTNKGDDLNGWIVTPEEEAVEFSSPILDTSEESLNEIYRTCEMLRDVGQGITREDGGHIHFDAKYFEHQEGEPYFDTKDAYANLMEIYCNCEKILLAISNAPGQIPRADLEYAKPLSGKYGFSMRVVQNDESVKKRIQEMSNSEFYQYLITLNSDREQAINFANLRTAEKPDNIHTIEFRFPNGTINPEVWIENVNLLGGLMRASKELAIIQAKSIEDLTEEDKIKLEILERLKTEGITNEQKVELLLKLLVSEEEKQTYIERFDKNYSLINELTKDSELGAVLEYKLAKYPVDFTAWRPNSRNIGEYCYTTNNPDQTEVDGYKLSSTQRRFEYDLDTVRTQTQNQK